MGIVSEDNYGNKKDDLTYIRSNKIALIFWAMINNNVITTAVFSFMLILDYVFQMLIIFCIYNEFEAIPIDMSAFAAIIEMEGVENSQFIQNIAIFTHCMIIIGAFIIFVFKNNKEEYFNEKNAIFKVLSFALALFRSILLTFYLIILTNNILNFNETLSFRFLEIFFLIASFVLISIITYFQAHFLNVTVPNSFIPWSETSPQPLLLENFYKLILGLAFKLRSNIALRYTFMIISIGILGYKILIRIRKSFIFNKVVFNCVMIGETSILHMLVIVLPARIFMKNNYFVFVVVDLLSFLAFLGYIYRRFRVNWVVNNADDFNNESEKLIGYLQMLDFYATDTHISKNYISQIHFSHQLKCGSYYKRLDKQLTKRVKKLRNQEYSSDQELNEDDLEQKSLIKNSNSPDHNLQHGSTQYLGFYMNKMNMQDIEEEVKSSNDKAYHSEMDVVSNNSALQPPYAIGAQFKSQNQSAVITKTNSSNNQSSNAGGFLTIFNKKNVEFEQKGQNGKFGGKQRRKLKNHLKTDAQQLSSFNLQEDLSGTSKIKRKQISFHQNNEIEINYKNQKRREKNHKNLIKHFFKYHLITEKVRDFQIDILRIYFTIKIFKNNFLAHFLLFNFINNVHQQDNLITRNMKILHQKFFESILTVKTQQQEDSLLKQIDLQKMLDLNQLYAGFEQQLDRVSDSIYRFWNNLIHEKETTNIYQKGIQISEGIKNIYKLYQEIELKQGDRKEIKIFIMMGAFYKLVVFKNEEHILEMQKSRHAHQTRKLARDYKERDFTGEKGLIIANLNLKKPMEITFANKPICKMLEYDQNEMTGMKINQLMPSTIAENHHKFIDRFMITGKYGLLSKRVQLFMKTKSGYMKPVELYLNVNHQNIKTMILLVDENEDFNLFEKDKEDIVLNQTGFMIVDSQLFVNEITKNLRQLCGLSNAIIRSFKQTEGNTPKIDDLFLFSQSDISTGLKQGQTEFLVQIKFENHLVNQHDNEYRNYSNQFSVTQIKSQKQMDTGNDHSQMFMEGGLQLYIVGLQKILTESNAMFASNHQNEIITQFNNSLQGGLNNSKFGATRNINENGQTVSFIPGEGPQSPQTPGIVLKSNDNQGIYSSTDQDHVEEFDLSISVNCDSLSNCSEHRDIGINSEQFLRCKAEYPAMGYIPNKNELVEDQFTVYCKILDKVLEDMRINQLVLDNQDLEIANNLGQVKLKFLSANDEIDTSLRYISQAVMVYTDYGFDLMNEAIAKGKQILKSKLTYFIIENTQSSTASLIERKGYFLIENSNQDLFYFMQIYAETYNNLKQDSIQSKINFQSIMTWICVGIVALCCIKDKKQSMINRIMRFQNLLLINSKNSSTSSKLQGSQDDYIMQPEGEEEDTKNASNDNNNNFGSKKSKTIKNDEMIEQFNEEETKQQKQGINQNKNRESIRNKKRKIGQDGKNSQINNNINQNDFIEQDEKDEEKDSDKSSAKKSRKNKKSVDKDIGMTNIGRQANQVTQMEESFNKNIRSQMIKQSLGICVIALSFGAYFLGTYLLSQRDFNTLTESIDILFLLFYRQSCVENVIHGVTETLIFNEPLYINKGQDEIMNYYQNLCYEQENQYQNYIRKQRPEYLSEVLDYIEFLESGQFCDELFGPDAVNNPGNVTPQKCKTYNNGLVTTGLTNIFQTAYKVTNQIRIEYENFVNTNVNDELPVEFVLSKFKILPPLLNIIEIILGQPLNDLNDMAIKSIDNDINKKQLTFILIYALFLFITVLVLLVFVFNIFRRLKREMLLSNRLLYILDFEATTDEERIVITKFLTKY
eukprot:403337267